MSDPGNPEVEYIPQPYNPLANSYYEQVLEGINQGVKPYRGKLVADLTELEKQGLAGLASLGDSDLAQQRMGLFGNLLQEELPFEVGPEAYDEYYRTAIEPLARRNFDDKIQEILHRGASGGSRGSTLANLGDALTNFELGQSAQRSAINLQGAERRQNLLMQNRAMLPGMMRESRAEEAFGPSMKIQSGDYLRSHDQAGLNAKFARWQMEQAYNNPWLGHIQGASAGMSPYPIFSGGGGGGVSPWLGMIPAAGGLLEGISSFF